jgi:ABC-type amino acid transport substrate-binding protein
MKWQPEPFETPTVRPFRSATVRIGDSSAFYAMEAGSPRAEAIIVPDESPIRTVADLKGRTVGVSKHYGQERIPDRPRLDAAPLERREPVRRLQIGRADVGEPQARPL